MHITTYQNHRIVLHTQGELTDKEEVEAVAIAMGRTTKESARDRGVSPETCKCQRAAAKAKVGATNQCEFILTLLMRGWLTITDADNQDVQFLLPLMRPENVVTPLDTQFHRAQALLKSNPRCVRRSGQEAVGPVFSEPAPGDHWQFELPTYLRRHTERMAARRDEDNRQRMAAYTQRVRARFQSEQQEDAA